MCYYRVMFVLCPCDYVIIVLLLCYYGGDVLCSAIFVLWSCYYFIMAILLCYGGGNVLLFFNFRVMIVLVGYYDVIMLL